jgi:hypothetical protein
MPSRPKSSLIAAALLMAALAVPGAALAVGGNHVRIKGPHKAHVLKKFRYTVSGRSSSSRNVVATFLNTAVKCKRSFKLEMAYDPLYPAGNGDTLKLHKGHFGGKSYRFKVTPETTGTHYICAYIINKHKRTLAKASSKYTTS